MSSAPIGPNVNTAGASAAVQNATGSSALQQLSGNLDTFLKLLTTQLQNQDPTQPLDTAQFTQQLVEYSQVEQQINTNKTLGTISGNIKASAAAAVVNYINQDVTINGSTANLANGQASWSYTLPSDVQALQLSVSNSTGKTVAFLAGDPTAGTHSVGWNGQDQSGAALPPGQYTLTAVAKGSNGAPVAVSETATGKVTGVSFDSAGNPQVIVGGRAYLASNVLSIGTQGTGP